MQPDRGLFYSPSIFIDDTKGCQHVKSCDDNDACTFDVYANGNCTHTNITCNTDDPCMTAACVKQMSAGQSMLYVSGSSFNADYSDLGSAYFAPTNVSTVALQGGQLWFPNAGAYMIWKIRPLVNIELVTFRMKWTSNNFYASGGDLTCSLTSSSGSSDYIGFFILSRVFYVRLTAGSYHDFPCGNLTGLVTYQVPYQLEYDWNITSGDARFFINGGHVCTLHNATVHGWTPPTFDRLLCGYNYQMWASQIALFNNIQHSTDANFTVQTIQVQGGCTLVAKVCLHRELTLTMPSRPRTTTTA